MPDLSTWEGRMAAAAAARRLVEQAENTLRREAEGDDMGEFEIGTAAIIASPVVATTDSYCLDLSSPINAEEFSHGPWRLRMTTEAGRRRFTVWHNGVEIIGVEGARDTVLTFLPAAFDEDVPS